MSIKWAAGWAVTDIHSSDLIVDKQTQVPDNNIDIAPLVFELVICGTEAEMSAKSTLHISRKQAEWQFIELYLERRAATAARKAAAMTDNEMEDTLERWNNERNDGESLRNYSISNSAQD